MQELFIKRAYKYCIANIPFLGLIILILFLLNLILDSQRTPYFKIISFLIISIFNVGYGLQITRDIINFGTRLPKIMPKKILNLGIKGNIITFVYITIQFFILGLIASMMHFPVFDLEEMLSEPFNIIPSFFSYDPLYTVIFIILNLIITYLFVFFMEIALAQVADGGKLYNSFNLIYIKRIISKIGWKEYTIDYTMVITSITILSFLLNFTKFIPYIGFIIDIFIGLMITVIEFGAIGLIYRKQK